MDGRDSAAEEDIGGELQQACAADDTMKSAVATRGEYTDGRLRWDWDSHYPVEARRLMNQEAYALLAMLIISLLSAGMFLGLSSQIGWIKIGPLTVWIQFRTLAIFSVGCLGGVTFSIKWLIHAAAKGKWHRDRRYWRLMVPALGGVYACVVMTLFGSGVLSGNAAPVSAMPITAALSFLVGYFADGVSGLLSNVANAVFGTLEKK